MSGPLPSSRCTEDLMDYRAGLEVSRKKNFSPCRYSKQDPLVVNPKPNHYTDCAVYGSVIRVNILQIMALPCVVALKFGIVKEWLVCRDV
jgi:hypothetical protein